MDEINFNVDRKELFQTLIDVLVHFINFCEEHNLTYYVSGGTLLGTIRHKGFIPWDDDIDIMMMRDDYDKMLELIRKEKIDSQYKFINPETDPYFPKAFTRFANSRTTMIPLKDALYKYNHGCFIDIFPVDRIPDSESARKPYFKRCRLYWDLLLALGRYKSNIGTLGLSSKKKLFYYLLLPVFALQIITPGRLFKSFNRYASQYNNKPETSNEIATVMFSGANPRCIFQPEDFSETIQMPFESIYVSVPVNYDSILTHAYGDYMTPVKQASEHGDTVYDPNIGYEEYLEQHGAFLKEQFFKKKTQG